MDSAATEKSAPVLRCSRPANLMEVCGTHSHALARFGIKQLLPAGVTMLAGPGCPVCVTPTGDIDLAIELSRRPGVVIATFGDMMRVPGSDSCLSEQKALGADVRVVYSPLDAVEAATRERDAEVVFIGVGFETTAPLVAAAVLEAARRDLDNFTIVCAHKLIPPAMCALLESEDVRIDGFLCPGHVSTIFGTTPYEDIAARFGVPCVIAGFEAADIILGLRMLLEQVEAGRAEVENAYGRCVRPEGNTRAQAVMRQVFEVGDAAWRGIGVIPGSGLALRPQLERFDAARRFALDLPPARDHPACRCGDILRGALRPTDCPLFGAACTPAAPVGPCMVSSEGACAAVYRYEAPL